MELGYFTMPLHPPDTDIAQTLQDDLEQLVVLDELGYSEAWIGEHFTSVWENIPAPDLFIANALGKTKNIRLGTGVTCMPNHNPFMIAHRIAQLDQMARGRFMWGGRLRRLRRRLHRVRLRPRIGGAPWHGARLSGNYPENMERS